MQKWSWGHTFMRHYVNISACPKAIYCGKQCILLLCWSNIFYLHWFGFISSLTYTFPWSSGLKSRYYKLSSMPICSSFHIVQYISWHVLFMNMYAFVNTHMHAVAIAAQKVIVFKEIQDGFMGKFGWKKWKGKIL